MIYWWAELIKESPIIYNLHFSNSKLTDNYVKWNTNSYLEYPYRFEIVIDNSLSLPADCSNLFRDKYNDVDVNWGLFKDSNKLSWSSVTKTDCMFMGTCWSGFPSSGYKTPWNSKITSARGMFANSHFVRIPDVDTWDVSSLVDASAMFEKAWKLHINILKQVKNWKLYSCQNLDNMFHSTGKDWYDDNRAARVDIDWHNFSTGLNLISTNYMLCDAYSDYIFTSGTTCAIRSIILPDNWSPAGLESPSINGSDERFLSCDRMFANTGIEAFYIKGQADWSRSNKPDQGRVVKGTDMFYGSPYLKNWDKVTDISRANNTTSKGYFGFYHPWDGVFTPYIKYEDTWTLTNSYLKDSEGWIETEMWM